MPSGDIAGGLPALFIVRSMGISELSRRCLSSSSKTLSSLKISCCACGDSPLARKAISFNAGFADVDGSARMA